MNDKPLKQPMSNEEAQLLQIIRDLKPYETIELKRDERGNIVYVYTRKDKYIFLVSS